jgi:hypothetical protein
MGLEVFYVASASQNNMYRRKMGTLSIFFLPSAKLMVSVPIIQIFSLFCFLLLSLVVAVEEHIRV